MSNGSIFVDEHCHLFPQRGITWSTFVLDSVAVHAHFEALFETTRTALVAVSLIDLAQTIALRFAYVLTVAADGALEKSRTPIARINSIVFARGMIATNFAGNIVQNSTCKRRKNEKLESQKKVK